MSKTFERCDVVISLHINVNTSANAHARSSYTQANAIPNRKLTRKTENETCDFKAEKKNNKKQQQQHELLFIHRQRTAFIARAAVPINLNEWYIRNIIYTLKNDQHAQNINARNKTIIKRYISEHRIKFTYIEFIQLAVCQAIEEIPFIEEEKNGFFSSEFILNRRMRSGLRAKHFAQRIYAVHVEYS